MTLSSPDQLCDYLTHVPILHMCPQRLRIEAIRNNHQIITRQTDQVGLGFGVKHSSCFKWKSVISHTKQNGSWVVKHSSHFKQKSAYRTEAQFLL